MWRRYPLAIGVLLGSALAQIAAAATPAPGALVTMQMTSTVGVLLDEVPAGALREQAAANALAKGDDFWLARARNQVRLMGYRLVFRGFYYPAPGGKNPKTYGPLPLTPPEKWNLSRLGAPRRAKINGHDLVVVDYSFASTIVTDPASPGLVDPNLGRIGGTASETFNLPVDPELLFERTGYACMDEEEFPPGSVFEENAYYYYDDACTPGATWCHVTAQPQTSCVQALVDKVGRVRSTLKFKRIDYLPAVADAYRVSPAPAISGGADLAVVTEAMNEERAFLWRFFGPGACELEEGVIGQYGWRRVLAFSATVRNDGSAAVDLGDVSDPANPYVQSNAFDFSPCHRHYHFSHYGTFAYAGGAGSKRAFCLEDTNRYHNDETTALTSPHQSCTRQGISAGWGDEYNFGIPGQWVDVTGKDTSVPQPLTFDSNPDQFLCEGQLVRDAYGNLQFDPTAFVNENGETEYRVRCAFPSGWNANNSGAVNVSSRGGSFVTEPCTRGQLGPNRNCDFRAGYDGDKTGSASDYRAADLVIPCATGGAVSLSCSTTGAAAVLRVCEVSGQNGAGVACTRGDAIANAIVGATPTTIKFACPAVRDAVLAGGVPQTQPGVGGYSVYRASLGTLDASDSTAPAVACTGG